VAASVDPNDVDSIRSGLAQLRKLSIEGLIVITPQSDLVSVIEKAISNIPVIYLDSPKGTSKLTATADSYHAARNATNHLVQLGHKNLLHVAGPGNWFDAVTRKQGFIDECVAAKVSGKVIDADWSIATGYKIGNEIVLGETTGIFAANDHLALGILKAFAKRGIRVPEQVSVIGFDDIPEAEYFDPPLTTLRPNFSEIGRVAMGLMLGQLNSEAVEKTAALIPELVIRSSTAKPRSAK
jgi:DNA-binding LacI/PurR family transcriptional regulator